jgi:ubiquitin thioesterase protein OTUB1
MDRPTDEEILQYERKIKQEEIGNTPLVSTLLDFDSLEQEYASGESIWSEKIDQLKSSCTGMRRIKKDGNCFYRAFAFRFMELVQNTSSSSSFTEELMKRVVDTRKLFEETGYDWSIIEFFWEPFWEGISDPSTNLHQLFNTEYTSDTIVSFMRILTAAFLKKHRELYEIFILDSHSSLEAFLAACVEPSNLD